MSNKVVFLIITNFLVLLNLSLPAAYAANENNFKHKEHAQKLVNRFFLDDKIGSCANAEQLSTECKEVLTDAVIISNIGDSFYLLPERKVYSRTLPNTEYKYAPFDAMYIEFDRMGDFKREKIHSALLELPRIFACIEAGCGRYSILPREKRHMSIKGHKDAIVYLECLLKIDEISFGRQALASWNYYSKNPAGYKISIERIKLNRSYGKWHRYLFMEHDQFKECSSLNTSRDALNLIIRTGTKRRPGTF